MIPGDEPDTTEFGLTLCRDAVREELWEKTTRHLIIDEAGSCVSTKSHVEITRKDFDDVVPLWVEKEGDWEVAGFTHHAKVAWRLESVRSCYRGLGRREWDCLYLILED